MNTRTLLPAVIVALLAIASLSVYTVDERELAIKFRLGKIIETDIGPGLHFKMPFINNVLKYPHQILTLTNPQELFLTQEKKNLLVDFFIKWRIVDVGEYYRATGGDESLAAQRMLEIVKDGIRGEFAKRTVPQVVTAERRELLDEMLTKARENALQLGIQVIDVRVKRTEFPEQVSDSVFDRMRQERARTASELRAQGAENAEQIRAEADRQRTVTLAEAYRDAEKVRGAGDAEAAAIYADAYRKDPDFFAFTRSIQAYRRSLGKENDLLLLDSKDDFFRYMQKADGGR
ncbi:MAG: protease modulator HflC [Gammaproteobacteria bacterium]|nr:protease modulator HflC [Gammaproteobacteria bacterium]MCP5138436.1 protease modulator HflC [Chromatiales bacterium]